MEAHTTETTRLHRPMSPNALWRRGLALATAFALGLCGASCAYRGSLADEARRRPVIAVYGDGNTLVYTNVHACGIAVLGCE